MAKETFKWRVFLGLSVLVSAGRWWFEERRKVGQTVWDDKEVEGSADVSLGACCLVAAAVVALCGFGTRSTTAYHYSLWLVGLGTACLAWAQFKYTRQKAGPPQRRDEWRCGGCNQLNPASQDLCSCDLEAPTHAGSVYTGVPLLGVGNALLLLAGLAAFHFWRNPSEWECEFLIYLAPMVYFGLAGLLFSRLARQTCHGKVRARSRRRCRNL